MASKFLVGFLLQCVIISFAAAEMVPTGFVLLAPAKKREGGWSDTDERMYYVKDSRQRLPNGLIEAVAVTDFDKGDFNPVYGFTIWSLKHTYIFKCETLEHADISMKAMSERFGNGELIFVPRLNRHWDTNTPISEAKFRRSEKGSLIDKMTKLVCSSSIH